MDCGVLLSQALATEKSAKPVTLLQRELKLHGKDKPGELSTKEELASATASGSERKEN